MERAAIAVAVRSLVLAACLAGIVAGPAASIDMDTLCARDCRPVVSPQPPDRSGRTCYYVSATFDGGTKARAVENSRKALKETIGAWRAGQPPDSGWRSAQVRVRAATARPTPYLRAAVPPDLMLQPDLRTAEAHTVCWRGVVSAAVCTSAAILCR